VPYSQNGPDSAHSGPDHEVFGRPEPQMEIPVVQWCKLTKSPLGYRGEHVVDSSRPALKVVGDLGVTQLAFVGRRGLPTAVRGVRHVLATWSRDVLVRQDRGRYTSARSQWGRLDREGCEWIEEAKHTKLAWGGF